MTAPAASPSNAQITVREILERTEQFLKQKGCESPRVDAEILLSHAWKCDRIMLYTRYKDATPDPVRDAMRQLVSKRASHVPIAYLVGFKEFFSMKFAVSQAVLVPRPETETLAAEAIRFLNPKPEPVGDAEREDSAETPQADPEAPDSQPFGMEDEASESAKPASRPHRSRVLDLGTGSGCLAITIAKRCPTVTVDAVDLSAEAIQLAERNTRIHKLADRVTLHEGDLFGPVQRQRYDLIVSNPPYVRSDEMATLDADVRDHEPALALDGGADGLDVVRRLLADAPTHLAPGGGLMLELDPAQMSAARDLLSAAGFESIRVVKDGNRQERVIVGHLPA